MEERINTTEDISKEIEKTEPTKIVTKEIAKKEERIAQGFGEVPFARDDFEERKEKAIKFLKEKKDWGVYLILAFIVLISYRIRTLNV